MIKVNKEIQNNMIITTMENLVPEDNLLRKIDKYIDFTFIEKEVKDLYSSDNRIIFQNSVFGFETPIKFEA